MNSSLSGDYFNITRKTHFFLGVILKIKIILNYVGICGDNYSPLNRIWIRLLASFLLLGVCCVSIYQFLEHTSQVLSLYI